MGEKIKGFVNGSDVLIWSSDAEIERLEISWRILGSLIGAHPEQPHQNANLSLPLLLLPQEVVLLLELGVLEVYEHTAGQVGQNYGVAEPNMKSEGPTSAEQASVRREEPASVRSEEVPSARSEEPASVRREEVSNVKSQWSLSIRGEGEISQARVHPAEESTRPVARLLKYWIPPATTTDLQQLKCRVYRDLWSHGYYLTSGLKFGGDFLVYEAHPRLTHATYIALVLPWQQSLDNRVGSLCRVAAQVRKNVLLCSERDHTMVYFTLEWTKLQ